MIRHFLILMFFLSVINHCFAQVINDSIYEKGHDLPEYEKNGDEIILKDNVTGTKFILDTARIYITAINSKGIQLWRTDPHDSSRLVDYIFERPTIVTFCFGKDELSNNQIVIWVGHSNNSWGYINKDNGHYTFLGQD